jgi:hypothetical protein
LVLSEFSKTVSNQLAHLAPTSLLKESEDVAPATILPPALEVTFDDAEDDVLGAETSRKRQRDEADEEEAGASAGKNRSSPLLSTH